MNFDFDRPDKDLERIRDNYSSIGGLSTSAHDRVFVSFPFLVPHPNPRQKHPADELFRTNIRLNQTYDQIGIFSRDKLLRKYIETSPDATHRTPKAWAQSDTGPDYGVFNFTDLFCVALADKPYAELGRSERAALLKRFEHKVSDHMPIWFRAPLPKPPLGFPTEV